MQKEFCIKLFEHEGMAGKEDYIRSQDAKKKNLSVNRRYSPFRKMALHIVCFPPNLAFAMLVTLPLG